MTTNMAFHLPHPDYKVTSIEKAEPATNPKDGDWYDYVISNEDSTITGRRCGTLNQVTQHAEAYSDQLNERIHNGGSFYRPKKPIPPKTP